VACGLKTASSRRFLKLAAIAFLQRLAGSNVCQAPRFSLWMFAREYQHFCKGKTRLYLFSEWMEVDPPKLERLLNF